MFNTLDFFQIYVAINTENHNLWDTLGGKVVFIPVFTNDTVPRQLSHANALLSSLIVIFFSCHKQPCYDKIDAFILVSLS